MSPIRPSRPSAPPSAASRADRGRDDELPAGPSRARPAHELDERLLRSVHLDLLGRPPYAAERERWLGRGLLEWLEPTVGSAEFWRHWLDEQLYYFLLIDNFRPESERVSALPEELAAGRLDVREAIHRIALSPSFDQRNPGADTFVTVVLEQLCGVNVQANARELELGKTAYDGRSARFLERTAASQADVVECAIESRGFATTFVAREHERLVRAPAAPADLGRWAAALRRDPRTYAELVRGWAASPAYAARPPAALSNRLFVRALFVDLQGELPPEEDARRIRAALDGLSDPTPLRSVVARLLLDSGRVALPSKASIEDPTAWIGELFLRLLARPASEAELAAFVTVFHEPDTRPGTVLYALVSHPEYALY